MVNGSDELVFDLAYCIIGLVYSHALRLLIARSIEDWFNVCMAAEFNRGFSIFLGLLVRKGREQSFSMA